MQKPIVILGGGTFFHVRNHLSIAAPAFGTTARWLHEQLPESELCLTRMAHPPSSLETNADVEKAIQLYLDDAALKCMVMNVAMCDFDGQIDGLPSGKHAQRLKSRAGLQTLAMTPSKKVIQTIKKQRPDLVLVGFKTTTGHSVEAQIAAAKRMGNDSACDAVFANDTTTRYNQLILANGTCVAASEDRTLVLNALVNWLNSFNF